MLTLLKTSSCRNEKLNDAVLFVHKNKHETNKHLQHKTWQNLGGINTYENIHLIQVFIYHNHITILNFV